MPTLSESASKARLRAYGFPFPDERDVQTAEQAALAAVELDSGSGVAVKLCGDAIAHKTERGLVRLGLRGAETVREAAQSLLDAATPDDGPVSLLVAPMLRGSREFIAGVTTDPQFGKVVMFGVGGVLAEAVADAVFRLAPLSAHDADEMLDDLGMQALLAPFRGEPAVDRAAVRDVLISLSQAAEEPDVVAIDVNPLIIVNGLPVAVDALIEVGALLPSELAGI